MNRGQHPNEKRFEDYIEKHLISLGYKSINYDKYDRNLCLIRDELLNFIKKTQNDSWKKLQNIYQEETENKVLNRISTEISRRGIIDVLRNHISDRGIKLKLCYFEPKSDLNPDHLYQFKSNQFISVRQLQ